MIWFGRWLGRLCRIAKYVEEPSGIGAVQLVADRDNLENATLCFRNVIQRISPEPEFPEPWHLPVRFGPVSWMA